MSKEWQRIVAVFCFTLALGLGVRAAVLWGATHSESQFVSFEGIGLLFMIAFFAALGTKAKA